MASDVTVDITDRTVISALNTPGGAVFEWRDEVGRAVGQRAINDSPVNDPLNALHRGGVVGTYKASWGWDRVGSNQHRVRATIYNSADHADIVEFGRRSTRGGRWEAFTWKHAYQIVHGQAEPTPGDMVVVKGTRGRPGQHILRDATNKTMPRHASSYTPV